ncbi:MAG TPA: peptidase S41 [Alphaproteobacteria bacterium]|nr:peptidase S41 [Alphaproteobacteria bacterium]
MNRFYTGVLSGIGICSVVGVLLGSTGVVASADTYRQLNLFGDVFERVRTDYVREVKDEQLVESAINGMLMSLDPHSSYMNPKNFADMQVTTRGEFGGLGLEVTQEDGLVKVITPMDETPAARAGIKSGDLISHIDGQSIQGLTLSQAVEKMRGPANTQVKLTILRKGEKKPLDVPLTRAIIKVESVKYTREGDIAHIRVRSFTEQTEEGLNKAVQRIKAEIGSKLQGVVLDLRNNPGGLLDQAITMSDAFLDQGEIVSTRGRRGGDTQRYNARRGQLFDGIKPGVKVVVLINAGSASASEIVAGALQDQKRAQVFGTRSFGKGSVQTVIPLAGGADGALRLTTAKYYTPSGRSIQALGIDPHVLVEQAHDANSEDTKERPSEADLPYHLDEEEKRKPHVGPIVKPKPTEKYDDFQLTYALRFLRGQETIATAAETKTETKPN